MNTARWNAQFNGKTDPVAFLERLEEIQVRYRLSGDRMLVVLPDLFVGSALNWLRNNAGRWEDYFDFLQEFRSFYLPNDYQVHLEEQVSTRRQHPQESGLDYVIAMETLMRRHGGMSGEKQLFWLHRNLLHDYRRQIRRSDLHSIRELIERIKEYEAIEADRPEKRYLPPITGDNGRNQRQQTESVQGSRPLAVTSTPRPPAQASHSRAPIPNPSAACWRCGSSAHRRSECNGIPVLFCSRCGRRGIFSKDCTCPRPEN